MRAIVAGMMLLGLAAAMPPALAQTQPKRVQYYEAFKRQKLLDCMADEVTWKASCLKKCMQDFRMDLTNDPPICIATKADAKFDPPKMEFHTPDKPPARVDFGKTGT